jgi:acyl-coenzyme A synthetase/AMP-(fatty) acid ligase
VRYQEDGSLEFIGRKDAQVKIRRQRIELEEIEHHIVVALGSSTVSHVIAGIVQPLEANSDPLLAAFFKPVGNSSLNEGDLAACVRHRLVASVPGYMIPQGYLIVDNIPYTISGKVDRNKLQKTAPAIHRCGRVNFFRLTTISRGGAQSLRAKCYCAALFRKH